MAPTTPPTSAPGPSTNSKRPPRERDGIASGRATKRTRAYTGCLTCRRRKIKCDEEHPVCGNCERIKYGCNWEDPSSRLKHPGGQTRRACDPCRSSKSACTFNRPTCATCSRRKIACTWSVVPHEETEQETSAEAPPVSLSSSLTADELARVEPKAVKAHILQDANVQRLIAVYFFRLYNVTWHGFLHKATFLQRLRKGDIPRHLLTSVCLSAAVVLGLNHEDTKRRLAGSLQQIGEAMANPTLDLLATIINTIYCEMAIGRSSSVWMLSGMANRIALAHQLTVPSPTESLSPTALEVRHRLMWACFCIDIASTQHSPELAQFSLEGVAGIPLPANERRFLLRQRGRTRGLVFPWVQPSVEYAQEEGMPAQNVIVFALCREVARYRSSSPLDKPWLPGSQFRTIYVNLVGWRASLNECLEYTEENVFTRLEMGQLTALFALHVRYNWALGTLLDMALQRYDDESDSDARTCYLEILAQHGQAWNEIPEAGAAIVAVMPEFVPEDPLLAEMLVAAIDVQISMTATTVTTSPPAEEAARRVGVLVELLVRMAKPFFGTRTQLINLLQRQEGTLYILLGGQRMNDLRQKFGLHGGHPLAAQCLSATGQNSVGVALQLPVTATSTANESNLDTPMTLSWNLTVPSAPTGHPDYSAQQPFFGDLAAEEQHTSPFDYANFEFALPLYQLANAIASSSTMSRAPEQADEVIPGEDGWDMGPDLGNDPVFHTFM